MNTIWISIWEKLNITYRFDTSMYQVYNKYATKETYWMPIFYKIRLVTRSAIPFRMIEFRSSRSLFRLRSLSLIPTGLSSGFRKSTVWNFCSSRPKFSRHFWPWQKVLKSWRKKAQKRLGNDLEVWTNTGTSVLSRMLFSRGFRKTFESWVLGAVDIRKPNWWFPWFLSGSPFRLVYI